MYDLKLKNAFIAPGRQVKNIGGRIVVFHDGVARNVSEEVANLAQRQHYIEEVISAGEEEVQPEVSPNLTPEVKPEVEETEEVTFQESKIPDEVIERAYEEHEAVLNALAEFDTEDVSDEEFATLMEEDTQAVEIQEPESFAETEETEDGVLTAEEIQALYDEHGTWSAVAKHLDVSTSTLRKYREDAGLL
jgi:hypothetical protein